MIRNRFTDMFDLAYPIASAPMGRGHSNGELAAAVSQAGGLGTFGAMGTITDPAQLEDEISNVRSRTDRAFGVGFITPFLPFAEALFETVLATGPPAVALSFADPEPWLSRAKETGARVLCQVQTFELARRAVDAGADVLVAQGNEAGGHTGIMGLLPFVSRLAESFPSVPLLAAGGIGDGRSLAAALVAGADGAWLGTAFLGTDEAPVPTELKNLIVRSDGGDTTFTRTYDIVLGYPWPEPIAVRARRNRFTDEWHGREAELLNQRDALVSDVVAAWDRGDYDLAPALYGPAAGSIDRVRPAAEVVRSISEDAERILRTRPTELLSP